MDTTDPDIWFDAQGVSSHAHHFDEVFATELVSAQLTRDVAKGPCHLAR